MTERRAIWSGISFYAVLAVWAIMLGAVGCREPEAIGPVEIPGVDSGLLLDSDTSCTGGGG